MVSRAWLEPKPVWEDNYQDEEGGVEEEVEGGHWPSPSAGGATPLFLGGPTTTSSAARSHSS